MTLLPLTLLPSQVCIHIHLSAQTHTHTHTHTNAYTYTCLRKHTHTYTHTYTYTHTQTHTHMHTHTHTHKYACVSECTHARMQTHTHFWRSVSMARGLGNCKSIVSKSLMTDHLMSWIPVHSYCFCYSGNLYNLQSNKSQNTHTHKCMCGHTHTHTHTHTHIHTHRVTHTHTQWSYKNNRAQIKMTLLLPLSHTIEQEFVLWKVKWILCCVQGWHLPCPPSLPPSPLQTAITLYHLDTCVCHKILDLNVFPQTASSETLSVIGIFANSITDVESNADRHLIFFFCVPSYISGFHYFWWDFWACDCLGVFLFQP